MNDEAIRLIEVEIFERKHPIYTTSVLIALRDKLKGGGSLGNEEGRKEQERQEIVTVKVGSLIHGEDPT